MHIVRRILSLPLILTHHNDNSTPLPVTDILFFTGQDPVFLSFPQ